jgi:pantothenate kinase
MPIATTSSPLLHDPVSSLLDLLAITAPNTRIAVGIAGVPGSGKTTFAAQLAARVDTALSAPGTVAVLGLDGFHLSKSRLEKGVDGRSSIECFARRGAPFTFDGEGFAAALNAVLLEGGSTWPDFDHSVGDPEPNAIIIPKKARLLIVEGIYVLFKVGKGWSQIPSLLSASWFLDTPRELANERLTLRHMKAWNFTREAALERIALNDGPNGDLVVESGKYATARVLPFE